MHDSYTVSTGTWNMHNLCILQTMDCTCMVTCTITYTKLWPILWHRVAYDFMHIETKMHESRMVGMWNMYYTHYRLNSLPAYSKYYIHKHWGLGVKCMKLHSTGTWNMHSFMHTSDHGLYLHGHVYNHVHKTLADTMTQGCLWFHAYSN